MASDLIDKELTPMSFQNASDSEPKAMADLATRLLHFINTELLDQPEVPVSADTELLLSGLLDSLAVAAMIDELETLLDVSIPPGDLLADNFNTVNATLSYLQRAALG